MIELIRTNDAVLISFVTALLADAEIGAVVLDEHTSVLEGSIGALPRRIMIAEQDAPSARRLLAEAGISCRDPQRFPS